VTNSIYVESAVALPPFSLDDTSFLEAEVKAKVER